MKKLMLLSSFCMMVMFGFSQTATSKTEVQAKPISIEAKVSAETTLKKETPAELEKKACDKDCKKACCKDKTKAEKKKCKKNCKKECCKAKAKACAEGEKGKKACCAKKKAETETSTETETEATPKK